MYRGLFRWFNPQERAGKSKGVKKIKSNSELKLSKIMLKSSKVR